MLSPSIPSSLDERAVFRSLFVAYPDALLLVEPSGRIALANPAAVELLGYPVQELIGLSVDTLVPDAVRPQHAELRQRYAQSPRARPMGTTKTELVAKRKDGSEVQVEIALSPLMDHGVPLVVASVRGVAAFPRVQQAMLRAAYAEQVAQLGRLAVNARDLQALAAQVPHFVAEALKADVVVMFLFEPDGAELRIVSGHGLSAAEVVGTTIRPPPGSAGAIAMATNRTVCVDDVLQETGYVIPPSAVAGGMRSALLVPIADRGKAVGLLAARSREPRHFGSDETRALEAMASLLATTLQRIDSEKALAHSQRLESVGQLTGGIAHDFNNLLTVIHGNLQVLADLPELQSAHVRELVTAASRASQRGAELTAKLLAFARRQTLQPSRVAVAAMLESLAEMLRRTLDSHIRVAVDVAPDCPPCLADPGQLESALLNIAINARDAMPEGGLLAFRATADAQHVAFEVSDSGCGMSEEVLKRAFEPFFTTKDPGRGTGLGLASVYGFVKQSRGAITLDSGPGRGTTVTLRIPRWRGGSTEAVPGRATAARLPEGLRVLLVEDAPEVSKVVQAFLRALRCEVQVCSDAEQALAAGGHFDVVLADDDLGPGLRGTDMARELRQRDPGLPVVLMSGYASGSPVAARSESSHQEWLQKPFTTEALAEAIVRALRR